MTRGCWDDESERVFDQHQPRPVIDERALYEALKAGVIAGRGLTCWEVDRPHG